MGPLSLKSTNETSIPTRPIPQSRLRECAEELQGALLDLQAKEAELENAMGEASALTRRLDETHQSSTRARSEAAEWKALAERYLVNRSWVLRLLIMGLPLPQ